MHPRAKILIVDDEPFNVDYLEQELDDLGYDTVAATDGQQALDQVMNESPDLVLLDIMMPVMDGFEVLGRLKADPTTQHIPVIIISAMSDLPSIVRGVKQGAEDYLPKPFEPVLLQARIAAGLEKKLRRDQELEYLRQVEQLTTAAKAIEANNFEAEMVGGVAARNDALGNLARVFQAMAEAVHAREQRIKRQLQQLQLDIEERQNAVRETAVVYIPMDRRQALARGETLPERTQGAALFADLSGFTPLTEALAQEQGLNRGAEEITRQLNRIYGPLIEQVHRYHGSVIGFSGDAITCWFDEATGGSGEPSVEAASLRALACALAMQEAMRQFATIITSVGTSISLAIKVAVVAGPVRRLLVGNPNLLQMDVLAGHTLDELAAAEHEARRGEVVIQGQVASALEDRIIISEWRQGRQLAVVSGLTRGVVSLSWPDLPPGSISDSQAQPWLLPSVLEKVCAGKSDFLSELRPAAALFMQFGGVDYDAEAEAEAKLNAFIGWVEQIVDQHEGALLQITVGDKGSYLYMAFGVPVAHTDDAARAVAAALELQSPPAELSYITGIQIGISYGQMRAGAYGSPAQRTYGAIGDKTNLAARLMQAAQTGIVCDEATYRAAQEQFDFEPLPPLNVKGKTQLINVYHPLQKRQDTASASASLVGRAAERALLIDRLSPADQLVLKAASVIGRVFAVGLLRDIYPDEVGKATLEACLESLEDLDLLVRLKQEQMPTYSFKDPLTYETAYNLMLFSQRRQLHRGVAEWHEQTYGPDSVEHYAVLARHWRQADDVPRAIFYLEKAGEQAQQNGEFEEARDFFNELLALDTQQTSKLTG